LDPKHQLGTKILGYIVVKLNAYLKIPVTYFLDNKLAAKDQEALTLQVIKDVEYCGFNVTWFLIDNLPSTLQF
jgi:hypothetical protein